MKWVLFALSLQGVNEQIMEFDDRISCNETAEVFSEQVKLLVKNNKIDPMKAPIFLCSNK